MGCAFLGSAIVLAMRALVYLLKLWINKPSNLICKRGKTLPKLEIACHFPLLMDRIDNEK